MSIALINDSVIFPDPIDWAVKPKWSRAWQTRVTEGVMAAEDRASVRTKPLQKLEYGLLAAGVQARSGLEARIGAALKKGRACVPLWTRPSELVLDAGETEARVSGIWPWRQGDYAFFAAPPNPDGPAPLINRVWRINCGGPALSGWLADRWGSGGSPISTAQPINLAYASAPAPAAVYQTAVAAVASDALNVITYTIPGLNPKLTATVRLHFAEIDPAFVKMVQGSTPEPRSMDITVAGDSSQTMNSFWPYAVVHYQLNNASVLTLRMRPSSAGAIIIKAAGQVIAIPHGPTYYFPAILNGIEVFQEAWEVRQLIGPTHQGRLSWAEPLRGSYPAGANVFPLLFGTPSVADVTVLTNRLGQVRLTVAEPLGEGAPGVPGQCGTEVCHDNDCFDNNLQIVGGGQNPPSYGPGTQYFPCGYSWDMDDVGRLSGNAVLWTRAELANEFAYALANNPDLAGMGVAGPPFWQYDGAGTAWFAQLKYATGSVDPTDNSHAVNTSMADMWTLNYPFKLGGPAPPDGTALWNACRDLVP